MPISSSCNHLPISTLLTNLLALLTIDGSSLRYLIQSHVVPSFLPPVVWCSETVLSQVRGRSPQYVRWLRMLGGEQWRLCLHLRLDLTSGIWHPARCTYTLRESTRFHASRSSSPPRPRPPVCVPRCTVLVWPICGAAGPFPAKCHQLYPLARERASSTLVALSSVP
ncbi:hypothetical protein C8Q74DRAFT_363234 [Fomes fomentarius]|nr:hypothetical protein C8Q74DRAFT_363234 [Fomes fomentarius]